MKAHGYFIALLLGTTALSACGGGGSVSTAPVNRTGNAPADQVLSDAAGNAAEALADDTTLTASARTTSGINRNYDAETAASAGQATAKVSRNASGALTLEAAGRTIEFAPGDLSEDGYGYNTDDASIWAWSADSMAEQLDPANGQNSLVFDYHTDGEDNTGQNAFIVVGTETDAADLATLPTASYEGWSRIRVAPTSGFADWDSAVSEARGDLNMAANFGAGTISGSLTNMSGRATRAEDPTRTWNPIAGSVSLNETAITGNGFSGSLSADSNFESEIGTIASGSTYSGTFFGSDADEVAGGFNLSGTAAEGGASFVGWGVFQGGKR